MTPGGGGKAGTGEILTGAMPDGEINSDQIRLEQSVEHQARFDGWTETEAQLEHIPLLESSDIECIFLAFLNQVMPPVPTR